MELDLWLFWALAPQHLGSVRVRILWVTETEHLSFNSWKRPHIPYFFVKEKLLLTTFVYLKLLTCEGEGQTQ